MSEPTSTAPIPVAPMLVLRRGDSVLVSLTEDLDAEATTEVADGLRSAFPGVDFVIATGIAQIMVAPPQERSPSEPTGQSENATGVTAQMRVLGSVQGKLANLPRDEFGEQHALATEAAYQRVEQLVVELIEQIRDQALPI